MPFKAKLPVGIENFEEIRMEGFYYVDKTGLIIELLNNWGKVNLFTRPRRFGKSLNMSMLKCFFELYSDKSIFNDLKISNETELCEKYMGQFPVISLSLKGIDGKDYEASKMMLRMLIGNEALRFDFLKNSDKLTEDDKKLYKSLIITNEFGSFTMPDEVLTNSLLTLSGLLQKHYKHKTIILIDEYDVPLDKAYQSGYYDDMLKLIRSMFLQTFKGNDSMYFAILTGCLRISKESMFTGMNNLNTLSVTDAYFDEHFGFTDDEIKTLLAYYDRMDIYNTIKEWYNGYKFGNTKVYCPWDVISYCYALRMNPFAYPRNYWANTSGNEIIKKLISKAKSGTKKEIETLIADGSINKQICHELTYRDLDSSVKNLWSVLFTTGYLTQRAYLGDNIYELIIPNKEIRQIFITQIKEWFEEETAHDNVKLNNFCTAFCKGDAATIEEGFNAYLSKTISIRDTSVQKDRKENFYHGILLGLLSHMENWDISSNAESGEGYSDILIEVEEQEIGIVIELKYAENGELEEMSKRAMLQIEEKQYTQTLIDDGMQKIIKYGIACYKKRCKVLEKNT